MSVAPTSGAGPTLPVITADARPTADTAALVRDPVPDVPLPIPPGTGQQAAVWRGALGQEKANPSESLAVAPVDRVLKPFGVFMLPADAKPDGLMTDDQPAPDNSDTPDSNPSETDDSLS